MTNATSTYQWRVSRRTEHGRWRHYGTYSKRGAQMVYNALFAVGWWGVRMVRVERKKITHK